MFYKSQMLLRIGIVLAVFGLVVGGFGLSVVPALAHDGRPLSTDLLGANEAPNPGDPDGFGHADITLNQGQGEVCFHITVSDVSTITAAHIHKAPVGVAGGVVVNFNVAGNGLSGCVSAAAALIKDIRQNPSDYYVNVHNADFPSGALRGQLSK